MAVVIADASPLIILAKIDQLAMPNALPMPYKQVGYSVLIIP